MANIKADTMPKAQRRALLSLFSALVVIVLMGLFTITANATTITNEAEPNDTTDQAQTITMNMETPQGYSSSDVAGRFLVQGKTTDADPDWFRVYLEAGDYSFTCNAASLAYEIRGDNGVIRSGTHIRTELTKPDAYEFTVNTSGFYLLGIQGLSSSETSYSFAIGNPMYVTAQCTVSSTGGAVTMTPGSTGRATFNAENISLPPDAIAEYVQIKNVRSSHTKSIVLRNERAGVNLTLERYLWDKDNLAPRLLPAASRWTATFTYQSSATFIPSLEMYYIYPVREN